MQMISFGCGCENPYWETSFDLLMHGVTRHGVSQQGTRSLNERLLLGNYWNQETGFVRGKRVYLSIELLNKACRFEHSTHYCL